MKIEEKMKKLMWPFMLLLAGMFLVSCGDDEEEEIPTVSSIIGIWYDEDSTPTDYEALKFDMDNKMTLYTKYEDEGGQAEEEHYIYEYDKKNRRITLKDSNGTVEWLWINVTIQNNRLDFDVYNDRPQDIEHYDFYRYQQNK